MGRGRREGAIITIISMTILTIILTIIHIIYIYIHNTSNTSPWSGDLSAPSKEVLSDRESALIRIILCYIILYLHYPLFYPDLFYRIMSFDIILCWFRGLVATLRN